MSTREVAVLIGTGSIGVAIARRTANGRSLVLADYNEAALAGTAIQLRDEGYEVVTHLTDVSDPRAVASLAETAAMRGTVTRVIHAAGVSPVQATTERVLQVDLFGTAHILDSFGAIVGAGGSGLVIASMAGHMGNGFPRDFEQKLAYAPIADLRTIPELQPDSVGTSAAAYTLAKRANILRVQSAATQWGERGARINALSPGIVSTPLAQQEMSGPNAAAYAAMIAHSAAGRMSTPAEIAEIAAVFMDDRGAFITGADLLIDGGVIAWMRNAEGAGAVD